MTELEKLGLSKEDIEKNAEMEHIKQLIITGEIKDPTAIMSYGYATQPPKRVDKTKFREDK
ncbi:hypothetical protein [Clostridium tyrobutyricum]|uniref:hypothetical protein n=1 Tax=Clostridium tyrobutyricum TaxID=1519 RepID=UPI001C3801A9|nr:hypothetical protein [Clostridium tyrobutyricum]MBV4429084.1 hypothetical protein [Clostridium tyrobutyricum]MBV4444161.1 hypothetical protein [Clostridium tyrobutyricum]